LAATTIKLVIKELRDGFALPTLCLSSFWATEAALSLATLTYNLSVLFQRHLGWQTKVTIHSLRFWLFVTAGALSYPRGKTTIKLAVPTKERAWDYFGVACVWPGSYALGAEADAPDREHGVHLGSTTPSLALRFARRPIRRHPRCLDMLFLIAGQFTDRNPWQTMLLASQGDSFGSVFAAGGPKERQIALLPIEHFENFVRTLSLIPIDVARMIGSFVVAEGCVAIENRPSKGNSFY